jgi:hypothetical protein
MNSAILQSVGIVIGVTHFCTCRSEANLAKTIQITTSGTKRDVKVCQEYRGSMLSLYRQRAPMFQPDWTCLPRDFVWS